MGKTFEEEEISTPIQGMLTRDSGANGGTDTKMRRKDEREISPVTNPVRYFEDIFFRQI